MAVELLDSLNGKFPCSLYMYPSAAQKTTTIMFLAVDMSQMIDETVRCPVVLSFMSVGPI